MHSSETFFCDEYHVSAGSVLFRFQPRPQICVLRNKKNGETVLPKGHKDLNETIEEAALRETYEETGWPCEFMPTDILTRVPPAGQSSGTHPRLAPSSTEAIAVTFRRLDETGKDIKFVWWFITQVTSTERSLGTQMDSENFDPEFVDLDEVVNQLSRPGDRDVVVRALDLVRKTKAKSPSE
ncbi:hypothetical protein FRB94_001037 [Tulasnella sp. JGI-2019a]|nr:hypothetical protein FRB94_001037 [Tulasnella sp. JGI-2019a]KAG9016867.1 hypothetical protein FRB93_009397 [Tulasnella sp. JGI-2019a]KAG9040235.1 hypothetical protein FRB95_000164 [Tulasnella sp. JGI-2019a]